MRHLLVYAQLVRLPNAFTAMADILLGALATGWFADRYRGILSVVGYSSTSEPATFGEEASRWIGLACLLSASTLLYWSGMIWNDYFDFEQDRMERPGRPLASGQIALRSAVCLGLGFMVGAVLLAALADYCAADGVRWRALWFALSLVAAIYLYDGVLKKTLAGPALMGICRSLNILMGLTILGTWPPAWGWLLAIVVGLYVGGVTWFASTEAHDSSRKSMLTGAAIVMLVSLALALTVPAMARELSPDFQPSSLFIYLLTLFGAYLGVAVVRAIRQPQPQRIQSAVKRAILGLIVLDALLASAFVGAPGLVLLLLLLPSVFLGRWLYST